MQLGTEARKESALRKRLSVTLALTALLLFVPPAAFAQAALEWHKFEPEDRSFSVLFPSKPSAKTHTSPDDPRMQVRLYSTQRDGLYYAVSSIDTAKLFLLTAGNFDAFVTGMNETYCEEPRKAGLECTLTFERMLKLREFPGRHYKVSLRGHGQSFRGAQRVYLVGSHVYTLNVIAAGEGDVSADKFFNSFTPAAAQAAPK